MRARGSSRATAHTAIAAHQRRGDRREAGRPPRRARGSPELPSAISDVAHEAVAPGALDRRAGETARGRRRRRAGRARRAAAPRAPRAARSRASRPACGELVPGADREAVVAAEDAVADAVRAAPARSAPCARSSGRRCSAGYRAGRAPERRPSGRRRGSAGRSRNGRARASSAGSSAVVKIAPRNSQLPNSRETSTVCLPCQPSPAAAASGFSITGAVSTNTLTSRRPARRGSRRAP